PDKGGEKERKKEYRQRHMFHPIKRSLPTVAPPLSFPNSSKQKLDDVADIKALPTEITIGCVRSE
ncbi:hypothetical protein SK128_011175, partial [Halocaridina rubra]